MMKNTTAASRQVEILLYAFTATFPCAFSWSNLAVHTNTYYHRAFNSIALYGYIGNLRMDNLITSCPFMLSVKLKKLCILLITLTHQVGIFIGWLIDHSFFHFSLSISITLLFGTIIHTFHRSTITIDYKMLYSMATQFNHFCFDPNKLCFLFSKVIIVRLHVNLSSTSFIKKNNPTTHFYQVEIPNTTRTELFPLHLFYKIFFRTYTHTHTQTHKWNNEHPPM